MHLDKKKPLVFNVYFDNLKQKIKSNFHSVLNRKKKYFISKCSKNGLHFIACFCILCLNLISTGCLISFYGQSTCVVTIFCTKGSGDKLTTIPYIHSLAEGIPFSRKDTFFFLCRSNFFTFFFSFNHK